MLIGLLILAANFAITAWLFNPITAFFATVCVLAILPPKYDPAIRWKEWRENRRLDALPECFGSSALLNPQDRALNGCEHCDYRGGCREMSWERIKQYQPTPKLYGGRLDKPASCPHGNDWDDCPDCRH